MVSAFRKQVIALNFTDVLDACRYEIREYPETQFSENSGVNKINL